MYSSSWHGEQKEKVISMRQFLTFIKKEFLHVFRDQKTLLLLFGLPVAQIVLFGFALTNEIKDSQIVISDFARDQASQTIIEKFRASNNFRIKDVVMGPDDIEEAFKQGDIKLAVVFPQNFEKDLIRQGRAQIQFVADASDPNTATTLINYSNAIIQDFQTEAFRVTGSNPMNISIQTRNIYNPELRGTTNFVPGVMALVLLLISVLMTSVSIVREKERGTMEILLVSPFNPLMVVIAKAVPYLLVSMVNLSVILLLSVFLLDLPINGSILLLFFISILLIMTALSLGLLISNVTSSQQEAMLISLMGMLLPTIMLTGFMFPLENMPVFLQVISNVVPTKWYYIIVKNIMIKGLGFSAVWKESLILLGMTLFFLAISIKKFKIRLS
jgi:ABC-2 type transport system permease protein